MDRRQFITATTSLLLAAPAVGAAAPDLRDTIERLERRSGGRLGVAVHDSATGRHFAWRADQTFPLCSTFKFLLVAALLRNADRGREHLARIVPIAGDDLLPNSPFTKTRVGRGASVAELCRAAIVDSDNAAANLLLPAIDGPAGFTRFARSLGDGVTRLDRVEPTLGQAEPGDPRDTSSPAAMLADMKRVLLGQVLSPASRRRLTAWLLACRTGKARLRAGFPIGWRVGDKTGSGMHGTSNDIAIAWPARGGRPLLVVAYLTGASVDAPLRDSILASVGRAVATLPLG
ncbi:MAG: Beta-lactamase [Alphaproteobacteria bacterium]|nr:Beta-lactamase [Alphaproteobacteria bacterium]